MKINLSNKKALVGGSSKGLGYAVAKQLASCGAIVTMVSRNESLLKKNIIELKKLTGNDHNLLILSAQLYFFLIKTHFLKPSSL